MGQTDGCCGGTGMVDGGFDETGAPVYAQCDCGGTTSAGQAQTEDQQRMALLSASVSASTQTIKTLIDRNCGMQAEISRLAECNEHLVRALLMCMGSLERANTAEGVCCCGDSMAGHANPMDCGHSEVDAGRYSARLAMEAGTAALKLAGVQ